MFGNGNISSSKVIFVETEAELKNELKTDNTCRICLLEGQYHDRIYSSFVSPCICTGSLKYAHFNCLKKWLQFKVSTTEDEEENFQCEVCHHRIEVQMEYEWKCRSKEQIKEQIKQYTCCFVASLIFLGILVASMCLMIILISDEQTKESLRILSISILVISTGLLSLLLYIMLKTIFIWQERTIKQIHDVNP